MPEIDGRAVISATWSTDGPHTTETVTSASLAVDELLRVLAHATIVPETADKALLYANTGDQVVRALAHAASTETQVLTQLAEWARRLIDDPTLYSDEIDPRSPDSHAQARMQAVAAIGALVDAASTAVTLAELLTEATSALNHIGHGEDTLR